MKRLFTIILLTTVLSAGGGCTKSDSPAEQGQGQVAFTLSTSDEVAATGSDQTRATRRLPANYVPDAENFTLTITDSNNQLVAVYESLNDYDQPLLEHGAYNAKFTFGQPISEGGMAIYYEGSTVFQVIARKTSSVSLTAKFAKSAISVSTSEWFRNYYASATLTVRTESGHSVAFSVRNGSQQPGSDAIDFIIPDTNIYLSGTAKKTNGVEVKFPETLIGKSKLKTWHTIDIDMSVAAQLSLSVILDDTLSEIPVEVELNPEA